MDRLTEVTEENIVYEHEKPVCYIGVYQVHLMYGGPEEGGWYYDAYEHKLSIPLVEIDDQAEIEAVRAFLRARFPEGDYRSVNPQDHFELLSETREGEHRTTERPYYE